MKTSEDLYTPKGAQVKSASARALSKMAINLDVTITTAKDLSRLVRAGLLATSFETFAKKGFSRRRWTGLFPRAH